jgi:hypothetical protein
VEKGQTDSEPTQMNVPQESLVETPQQEPAKQEDPA